MTHPQNKISIHFLLPFLFLCLFVSFLFPFALSAQKYGNEWIDFNKTYFKIPVRENRFFRIPQTTLAAYGLENVPAEHFQLWRDGEQVPLFTSVPSGLLPAGGFLEFIGMPLDGREDRELYNNPAWHLQPERSFFLDTAWYFLTVNAPGPNLRFTTGTNTVATTTLRPDSFYMETVRPSGVSSSFNGGFARIVGGSPIRSSTWDSGEGYSSSRFDSARTVEFLFAGLRAFAGGPPMQVQYAVSGISATTRRAIVRINNALWDSVFVSGFNTVTKTVAAIPLSHLVSDGIQFRFNGNNPETGDGSVVTQFALTYPRQFFHNQQLHMRFSLTTKNAGNHLRIAGLPNSGTIPALYDLTHRKRYAGVLKGDSSLFAIEPSATARVLVVGSQHPNHIRQVTVMKQLQFKNYLLPENQGNYLMICAASLLTGADNPVEAYRNYRSSAAGGSYKAMIYDMEEIAEQFGYGVRKTPLSIRRFILYAIDKFQEKPKMVFLIGRGNNYRSYQTGTALSREPMNTLPTWGIPGSDNQLAARNNLQPVPEIPIGRLSAVNRDEVATYLDKVQKFEALQRAKPFLPSDNEWRKQVIHLIGGDDEYLADSILSRFMTDFGNTIKPPGTGMTVQQFTRPNNPQFAENMLQIEERISKGVGLLTYFGHSSASSIDFNLGSPEQYANSGGRYPVFIANGCRAGNIFDYTTQRLTARETSISDNFIFAPDRGAIAFISNSDLGAINYQSLLTREWYRAFSGNMFGKTIGEIQREALQRAFARTGSGDFFNRCNIEQNVLHADPAIVPFAAGLPDFAVEGKFMATNPARLITETDSVSLSVHIFNLGVAVADSVWVKIERELPDGNTMLLYHRKHANLFNEDSIYLTIPVKGLFEEGNGQVLARIDPANEWTEADKDNNVAVIPFVLQRNHVQPVMPLAYSIVNTTPVVLRASTTNPAEIPLLYTFETDTTAAFNSPLRQSTDTLLRGGLLQYEMANGLIPGTVYYWRVYKTGITDGENVPVFSFLYQPGSATGFNQSHYYQHRNSTGIQVKVAPGNEWHFMQKMHNVYAAHGIYQSSGTEDTHFSLTVNGAMDIRSACLGRSIIFNLFDARTFEKIKNAPLGSSGSADSCAPGREYNFEFRYFDHTSRKRIMDFIDSIAPGTYVAARLVVDRPYDSLLVQYWKADTAIYGSGKSLFHSLVKQGFYELDSLNRPRTFFFMFRKDDSSIFKPYYKFSRGLNDRVHASIYPLTPDFDGELRSPQMGPASRWNSAVWEMAPSPNASPAQMFNLALWGKNKSGLWVKLRQWQDYTGNVAVNDIPAAEYSYLQFRMQAKGNPGELPPQLRFWQLYYDPLADGAWSSKDSFYMRTTTLKPSLDTISLRFAFVNAGTADLASLPVNMWAQNESGGKTLLHTGFIRATPPGDTVLFSVDKEVMLPEGNYRLLLEANPDGNPAETNYFNNLAVIPFVVTGGTLPLHVLTFTVREEAGNGRLYWESTDDPHFSHAVVSHSYENNPSAIIFSEVHPQKIQNGKMFFEATHEKPLTGTHYYRIGLVQKDGGVKWSSVAKLTIGGLLGVKIFPNPFSQYFTLQPVHAMQTWQILVLDASGRAVFSRKGMGTEKISLSGLPAGSYHVRWQTDKETGIITLLKQ